MYIAVRFLPLDLNLRPQIERFPKNAAQVRSQIRRRGRPDLKPRPAGRPFISSRSHTRTELNLTNN